MDHFLGGIVRPATDRLDQALAEDAVVLVDLVVTEVLQGMAAGHYPLLRSIGITVRKTIDTLIATRCIADGLPLLYSDRGFDPFVARLGLVSGMDAA